MGGTLSCAGKGKSPKDEDKRPYGGAPPVKSNGVLTHGVVAPSEKYIVPSGNCLTASYKFILCFTK